MPELPEVETIRSDLQEKIVDQQITNIEVKVPKLVKSPDFEKKIKGKSFKNVSRRGKLLVFEIENDLFILIHLKMTGQLIYQLKDQIIAGGHSEKKTDFQLPNNYSHVIFHFENGGRLFFNDSRQFGYLKTVNKKELEEVLNKFGYEPLEKQFTLEKFQALLQNKKQNIKAFLLNQHYVAGIGNIYVDEILFASRVSPSRTTNTLTINEIKIVFKNIKDILKKAIEYRGTTFNTYVDSNGRKGNFIKFLKVYQRQGEKCLNCGTPIKKTKIAGRGTHFCPKCQK